jgi:flagellar assembly factor FliW
MLTAGSLLTVEGGLVGLPSLVRFDVRPIDDTPLIELASTDEPGFVVVAVRAELVRPGMEAALAGAGLLTQGESLLVLLSVHDGAVTANLAGPLVVAPGDTARQLVVEDPDFPLQAAIGHLDAS